MKRRSFLTTMVTSAGAVALESTLRAMADELVEQDFMMPAFFIGHGSPMNALEDNVFTRGWREAMANIPKPKAIICVSAHWLTKGTWITAMPKPRTIHDFGGFPRKLTEATVPGGGFARRWLRRHFAINPGYLRSDWIRNGDSITERGLILMPVFPDANIPVMELSIDYDRACKMALRAMGQLLVESSKARSFDHR